MDDVSVLLELWVVDDGMNHEDIGIFTISGVEVLGSSEWIRVDMETLIHIVALHNKWLEYGVSQGERS